MHLDDFTGFQFKGVHTSDLGIVSVSNGSRYTTNLTPGFQDTTVKMPGSDYTLYWESFYTSQSWTINIAFDNLSEVNFRKMRQTFNGKDSGELIFDETPYKAYTVKLQSPIQLNFICFDDPNGERVYKGEGILQFVAYYPFARSVYKYLNQYNDIDFPNKAQWSASSGLLTSNIGVDELTKTSHLYNAGDIDTDLMLYYSLNGLSDLTIELEETGGIMQLQNIIKQNNTDVYIRFNSKTHLIEGCDSSYIPTGSLYNRYLIAGDFFKIPLGHSTLSSSTALAKLEYNYYYY